MKRIICILVAILSITTISAQNRVEDIIKTVRKEKGTDRVSIGGFMMTFAKLGGGARGVKSVEVISLDDCSVETKNQFRNSVRKIKDPDYETLVNANSDRDSVKILIKLDDQIVRDLVIISAGDDCALIRIKGNIKLEDIDSLVESNNYGA